MNSRFAQISRPTTRAADGLPRWSWTVAEIERMAAGGYFRDEDRFELVGGEIVPMSPKGRRHEIVRVALAFRFSRAAPEGVFVASEPQFNLAEDTFIPPPSKRPTHEAAMRCLWWRSRTRALVMISRAKRGSTLRAVCVSTG
jgi:hypothetical protein